MTMLTTTLRKCRSAVQRLRSIHDCKTLRMATTTAFFRNLEQLETLHRVAPNPRRVYVFACSMGSETYSLAIFYAEKGVDSCQFTGFDVNPECLRKANSGVYLSSELEYGDKRCHEESALRYIKKYMHRDNEGGFGVSPEIRSRCRFEFGSILDAHFMNALPPADIVLCQNVLIHLTDEENALAIPLLTRVIRPGGILMIGGMRLPIRAKTTRDNGLTPITDNCEAIHESQKDLRRRWDNSTFLNRPYTAMPRFSKTSGWEYRFATIFRTPEKPC